VVSPFGDRRDRLAGKLEWDRHVTQELAVGPCDDCALVADDWIVERERLEVRAHGTEHAARDDDHMDARLARCTDSGPRSRMHFRVLGDQRAVEVAGERLDVARKVLGKSQLSPATDETYAATS
jgi:hypothetical protein